jgi:hypothetical protein
MWGMVAAATAAGCSAGGPKPSTSSVPPAVSHASPTARPGVSSGGVTTRVDAPAQSTEEEYFQACHAAKTWMQNTPGDPQTHFERYLAAVQLPHVVGPGTWNVAWERLSPARQAAVIVAARAAANDECG